MNPSDAETIFEAARQLDSPAKRAQYLDLACGDNVSLREKIDSMLSANHEAEAYFQIEGFGNATQAEGQSPTQTDPIAEQPGTKIGRYKLLQQIGEGGMGVVFMAEQEDPVRRKVALKIIKMGMDTKSVVARFEAERQALAMMDHPSIAKVLDAGATETGRPYFVMELVKGVPINQYCDKAKLDTQHRLGLFSQVCLAIQHAHQKGIIHRDIKPSNILVTLNEGIAHPMVIDFGIAKATHQRLTEKTLFTNFAQMIGTPAYMSPEQAEMSKLDVDTRSDIYSLGVLLYELLTGTTPHAEKELLSQGYGEMQRIIAEEEPPRPSLRMSTLVGEQQSIITQNRAGDAPLLTRQLRGDLDWIVMKSLEKDRTRRYETANGIAEDIRRHLRDEPVLAAKPSFRYQFAKLYYRHKPTFAAAAGITLALIVGTVVSTTQAISAQRAKEVALQARSDAEMAAMNEQELREEAQLQRQNALALAEERRLDAYIGDLKSVNDLIQANEYEPARELLLKHRPAGPEQTDLRGFEWRYLWEASAVRPLEENHVGPYYEQAHFFRLLRMGLALSHDQRTLVVRVGTKQLMILDPATLRVTHEIQMESKHRHQIAFSPDDARLYVFTEDEPIVGRRGLRDHQLALHIYETKTWTLESKIPNAYPPLLMTDSGDPIFLAYTNPPKLQFPNDGNAPRLTGEQRYRTLKQRDDGSYHAIPALENLPISDLDVCPHYLSPGIAPLRIHTAKEWRLWDISNPQQTKPLRNFTYGEKSARTTIDRQQKLFAFNDLENTFSLGQRRRVRLFNLETGIEQSLEKTNAIGRGRYNNLVFTEDGRLLLASSNEGLVYAWDTESGVYQGSVGWHSDIVSDFVVRGRQVICLYRNGDLKTWSLDRLGAPRVPWTYVPRVADSYEHPLPEQHGPDAINLLHPDYLKLIRSETIRGWLPYGASGLFASSGKVFPYQTYQQISPSGRYLMVRETGPEEKTGKSMSSKPKVRFYDLQDRGKPIIEWDVAPVEIWSQELYMYRGAPHFVSDRHLIYENPTDLGARLEVWDLEDRTRTPLSLPSHFQPTYMHDFLTADLHGDTIALGCLTPSGHTAVLWSLSQDRQLAVVPYGNLLTQVRFSPDGRWLALTGENPTVYLIDTATGASRHQLRGHIERSWASFTPDGRTVMTEDKTGIRFWNLATGRELVKLERSELEAPWLQELEFTRDGRSIYGSVVKSGHKRLKFLTPRSLEEIEEELAPRR